MVNAFLLNLIHRAFECHASMFLDHMGYFVLNFHHNDVVHELSTEAVIKIL